MLDLYSWVIGILEQLEGESSAHDFVVLCTPSRSVFNRESRNIKREIEADYCCSVGISDTIKDIINKDPHRNTAQAVLIGICL